MQKILFKHRIFILLVLIIVVAVFLRFWQLGQNPPSLEWDEAAWGYNAYSIGLDGKDEFGVFLPYKYIESFGDFKPPVYAYLTVIPVKIFGLNEFATRFASAFFGTLTVLLTYFLVLRLFSESKNKYKFALLSAFFLAISPWHINLSRAAFEANVSTFFIVCGIWLFLGSIQEKKWYLPFSVVSFALSFYTFNTARIFVPILVCILTIGFYKQLLLRKKITAISIVIGLVMIVPLIPFLLSPQSALRYQEVNIFSDIQPIQNANQEVANDNNAAFSKILHNRRLIFTVLYLQHYFDNLNPVFLFISGDPDLRFSTGDVGEMYLLDAVFLVLGILFVIKNREENWWILFLWLLAGIIPAATARETPHALRIETTLPTFQILSAIGCTYLLLFISRLKVSKSKKNTVVALFGFLLLLNFAYYLHGYYAHYPKETSRDWEYGYKQSIAYVASVQNQYDQIDVSNVLGRQYIYYLFYTKTSPEDFRSSAKIYRDTFGFVHVLSFGKYEFQDPYNHINDSGKKVLYLGDGGNIPANVHIKKVFKLLNGQPIFVAYTL